MPGRFNFSGYLADERKMICESLTKEEADVFRHRAQGDLVVKVARDLHLSERTIIRRSGCIMNKIRRMQRRQMIRG